MPFLFDPSQEAPSVVATIGVFDGVHRGHQVLLAKVRARAEELQVQSMVITFDPHPVAVLAPHLPPRRIGSRKVEERWLGETRVDFAWFLTFSKAMSEWPPEKFLTHLTSHLNLRELWIGYDFRFGRGRAGDAEFLLARSHDHNYALQIQGAVKSSERVFSSTWVRELLAAGAIPEAESVLGHPFEVEGEVVHGQGLGSRELVATANLLFENAQLLPQTGIYVGWAQTEGEFSNSVWLPALASIGHRPTVEEEGHLLLEVHLMDWDENIYGQTLKFRFGARIRGEERFDGLEALREAIAADLNWARRWFRERTD